MLTTLFVLPYLQIITFTCIFTPMHQAIFRDQSDSSFELIELSFLIPNLCFECDLVQNSLRYEAGTGDDHPKFEKKMSPYDDLRMVVQGIGRCISAYTSCQRTKQTHKDRKCDGKSKYMCFKNKIKVFAEIWAMCRHPPATLPHGCNPKTHRLFEHASCPPLQFHSCRRGLGPTRLHQRAP